MRSFEVAASLESRVSPAIPILFFGDLDAYAKSQQRVLTVGLNPSRIEFPAGNPAARSWAAAFGCAPNGLSSAGRPTCGRPIMAGHGVWTAHRSNSDVLNDNMIAAWPRVAAALEGLDCALMGGTAVAMVLRHRHSHDLDFMTLDPFDSRAVRIAQLATSPPPTDPGPALNRHLTEAASHLATRRRAVLDWALQSGQRPRPPQPDPPAHEL